LGDLPYGPRLERIHQETMLPFWEQKCFNGEKYLHDGVPVNMIRLVRAWFHENGARKRSEFLLRDAFILLERAAEYKLNGVPIEPDDRQEEMVE